MGGFNAIGKQLASVLLGFCCLGVFRQNLEVGS